MALVPVNFMKLPSMAYLGNIKCKLQEGLFLKCIIVDLEIALQTAMLYKFHYKADLWILDHAFDLNNIWMLQTLDGIITYSNYINLKKIYKSL
jgi:hypothetical protein